VPLTLRVVPGSEEQAPPGNEHQDRFPRPPVKEAGSFGPERLPPACALARAGFCNRNDSRARPGIARTPRRRSKVALVPDRLGGSAPFEATPGVLHGSGESVAAFAAPHPPPGAPGGITPKPIRPSTTCRSPSGRAGWRSRPCQGTRPSTSEPAPRLRGTCRQPNRSRDRLPGGRIRPLLREEEEDFPEPGVPSNDGEPCLPPAPFSTDCCQPVDGSPAWPPQRARPSDEKARGRRGGRHLSATLAR